MLCCRKAFVDLWLFVGLKATEQGWQASKQAMNLIYYYQQTGTLTKIRIGFTFAVAMDGHAFFDGA
jgi:hypothetical protein